MRITILGSGTSTGVPQIGCQCKVCTSKDRRDKRLRTSALIETDETRLLIDCGPDFREQIMRCEFKRIDAVLLTHEHYDHVGGVDDLRPFCTFGNIPLYGDNMTLHDIRRRIPYCFKEKLYPGVPHISTEEVYPHVPFSVGAIEIIPLRVLHGALPILGYRIGKMAYITDMKTMEEEEYAYLKDLDCLIINALRLHEHNSHQTLADALAVTQRIGAKNTYLIHMCHQIGLHAEVEQALPSNVHLTYDGMIIDI